MGGTRCSAVVLSDWWGNGDGAVGRWVVLGDWRLVGWRAMDMWVVGRWGRESLGWWGLGSGVAPNVLRTGSALSSVAIVTKSSSTAVVLVGCMVGKPTSEARLRQFTVPPSTTAYHL